MDGIQKIHKNFREITIIITITRNKLQGKYIKKREKDTEFKSSKSSNISNKKELKSSNIFYWLYKVLFIVQE